jgi:hypothetical protein
MRADNKIEFYFTKVYAWKYLNLVYLGWETSLQILIRFRLKD